MTLLHVRALRVRRGERCVVDDVELSVGVGEQVAIMGHNGSGKTSLLRALVGLLPVDAGTLQLEGRPVRFGSRALRSKLGVVFQEFSHDAKLTVHENLRLGARLFGLYGRRAAQAIDELVCAFGLDALVQRRGEQLSGGQRRRVELARALLHRPRLLVLDEPSAGLDPAARHAFAALIAARQKRDGLGVLLTTHDAHEAQGAQRVVLMGQGRVLAADTPAGLLAGCPEDVIVIEAAEPEAIASPLRQLGLEPHAIDSGATGRVGTEVRVAEGHLWVPKIFEALRACAVRAVHLRRATLADVLMRLQRQMGADREAS